MRDFRFRAWNKAAKEMCYASSAYILACKDADEAKVIVVMQFTGLHDKNGKEIYEGDVVKFMVDYSFDDPPIPTYNEAGGTVCIDTVEFIDGAFYFVNREIGGAGHASRHNKYCEVIGNIHETPELLETP